ncbi:MAG: glycosyltransferase, partial [Acidimicrobiia bacterium]
MKLLYITNGFPYPLTSGYLRHYFLLRGLAAHHDITLLSMVGADHRREHRDAVADLGVTVRVFPRSGGLGRRIGRLTPGPPLGGVAALARAARGAIGAGAADAVVLSGKETAAALPLLRGAPLLVDLCDATSSRFRAEMEHAAGRDRLRLGLQWAAMRRTERRLRQRADRAMVASERDRLLLGWPVEHCTVVPNGVDTDYWRRASSRLGEATIIFTGKLDYRPNEDAALRLVEDVLPMVRRRRPATRLLLVGRSPTERLRRAALAPGVELTGDVPDMRPYLEQASVLVAPLRFGAGIQNKVLEAMSMEVPVVCTENAAAGVRRGLEPLPLDVAAEPAGLAEAAIRALHRVDLDARPDERARRYVQAHFRWPVA